MVKKLLAIGLFASVLTGIGDFLLGYAEETADGNYAASVMSGAPNLADWQMIAGGLCGLFGIFLEGLAMLPNQERFDAFEKRLMESEAI